jgi:hypothetical protein
MAPGLVGGRRLNHVMSGLVDGLGRFLSYLLGLAGQAGNWPHESRELQRELAKQRQAERTEEVRSPVDQDVDRSDATP